MFVRADEVVAVKTAKHHTSREHQVWVEFTGTDGHFEGFSPRVMEFALVDDAGSARLVVLELLDKLDSDDFTTPKVVGFQEGRVVSTRVRQLISPMKV